MSTKGKYKLITDVEPIQPIEASPEKSTKSEETHDKFVVVHFEGGLGKHVAGTAVIRAIKKAHPERKIVLTCAYPELFLWNPDCWRVYGLGNTPYFFEDYISGKDTIILKQDPYSHTEHIHQRQSLIKSWVEVFGLDYNGEEPLLYVPYRIVELTLQKYSNRPKPIMLLHTNGGPYRADDNYDHQSIVSWSRDMPLPVSQAIINKYKDDYHIIQVCKSKVNVIPGVEAIVAPQYNLELMTLLRLAKKRILIDSCLQHASAAFKLPSVVLWNGTAPKVFGYDMHRNILPSKNVMSGYKNIKAYLYEYELSGDPLQCPYDSNDLYNVDLIFDAIESI